MHLFSSKAASEPNKNKCHTYLETNKQHILNQNGEFAHFPKKYFKKCMLFVETVYTILDYCSE